MTRPLLDSHGFRTLIASRSLSFVGAGVANVALVVLAARHGPTAVGLVFLAGTLPALAGPLAGAVADRVQARTLLAGCECGQALLLALVAVSLPGLPVLVTVAILRGALATLFAPAGRAALPALVPPGSVDRAYSVMGSATNLQLAVGPAVGGLVIALAGVRVAFVTSTGLLLGACAVLTTLPLVTVERSGAHLIAEAVAGLRFVARNRTLRALTLALSVFVAFAALDNVALVFLVRDELHAGPGAYGLLTGAAGGGMVVASAGLTAWRGRLPAARLFLAAALVEAVGLALVGLAPNLVVAAAGQVLAGAGNGVDLIALDVLVQRAVPRPLLGRAFGTVGTAVQLGLGVAYAGSGPLVAGAGARGTFLVAAAGSAAVCVLRAPVLAAGRSGPAATVSGVGASGSAAPQ